jgi:hypothetical protein
MASIKRPVLSVREEAGGAAFTFTVTYTAVFEPDELNETFLDCIQLLERDVSSTDDELTPPCVLPESFVASRPEVPRTKRIRLSDRQASTELGNEEIYAIVVLSGSTTGGPAVQARTNELEVRT